MNLLTLCLAVYAGGAIGSYIVSVAVWVTAVDEMDKADAAYILRRATVWPIMLASLLHKIARYKGE